MKLLVVIDSFDIKSIEKAYTVAKGSVAMEALYGTVLTIAILLIVRKAIALIREAYKNKDNPPTMSDFVDMLWMYAVVAAVISILPFVVTMVESILSEVQSELVGHGEGFLKSFKDQLAYLTAQKLAAYPNGISFMDGPLAIMDYIVTVCVLPMTFKATEYLYSIFLAGRYMVLLMLEIVAPIAIICFLGEKDTQQYFLNWCKYMILCYLLVPFFLLANIFASTMTSSLFEGEVTMWWAVISSFVLKLYLFKMVKQHINSLF